MKILAFSEHFFPRVAGTVEYVHQTCQALQQLGHEVHLIVPSSEHYNSEISGYPYQVTGLGVEWPKKCDPSRQIRYRFCSQANEFALEQIINNEVDIIHVLFGFFLSETLDTRTYTKYNIPCLNTVHNVPPQECARSWSTDRKIDFFKDQLRLTIVAFKNRQRLRKNPYNCYIVPSHYVKNALSEVLPKAQINIISHGYSKHLLEEITISEQYAPGKDELLRLLTVGGWVPHKRQHLIPKIAAKLRDSGLNFSWDIVGPPGRIPRYQQAVKTALCQYQVDNFVKIYDAVPHQELVKFYQKAHLYVQPSIEEGFCMAALNAAAAGCPVIACPTGALPEIVELSGGVLIQSQVDEIAKAIRHFTIARLWHTDVLVSIKAVKEQFSWQQSAHHLELMYMNLGQSKNRIDV